ncbi:TPA: hypothetical protein PFE25_004052 [Kluyvera ascorbata]|nr:hypothetical protein [Kluyvera ascorbata]
MICAASGFFDSAAAVKEITAGATVSVLSVATADEAGVSAVGITTRLAVLDGSSMPAGVAVAGVIDARAYSGMKKLIQALSENE